MSNYIYYNGELYHFGVKGMKWGHRKAKQEAKANYKAAVKSARQEYDDIEKSIDKKYAYGTWKHAFLYDGVKQYTKADQQKLDDAFAKRLKKEDEAFEKYKGAKKEIAKREMDDKLRSDPEFQKKQRVGREVANGLLTTGGMAALTIYGHVKPDSGLVSGINTLVGGAATLALGANAISRILVAKLSK